MQTRRWWWRSPTVIVAITVVMIPVLAYVVVWPRLQAGIEPGRTMGLIALNLMPFLTAFRLLRFLQRTKVTPEVEDFILGTAFIVPVATSAFLLAVFGR